TATLLRATLAELPADRPRYLMGVGHPADLVSYAKLGVDLFDCVLPTRLGRNGTVWCDMAGGRLDLGRQALLGRSGPIAADCTCLACTTWPIGGLAALFQSRSSLAYRLASMHNLTILSRVADDLRRSVVYTAEQRSMLRSARDW
ncbi:MAG: tRNA-guanine transglycosylase, partial [Chloroflexi bacterium]|nr:tRNA-guanine transglycosylase [Chloroflexota bacterium]